MGQRVIITVDAGADVAERRSQFFKGLAEPSRLRILVALTEGPKCVSDLVDATGLSQPNASNHLACLLGCGLVTANRAGRFVFYRLASEEVSSLLHAADRIADDASRENISRPHCGTSF